MLGSHGRDQPGVERAADHRHFVPLSGEGRSDVPADEPSADDQIALRHCAQRLGSMSPMSGPVEGKSKLSVAIVSYRCEALLRNCLLSVYEFAPAGGLDVEVVDNASGDGTAE